jgi:hypothetical protein
MDWLTFVVDMTKAVLSWPLATLAIVLLLRSSIAQLIPEIRKFKLGDVLEIDIGEELRQVEAQADAALPQSKPIQKTVTVQYEAAGKAGEKAAVLGQVEVIDSNKRAAHLAQLSPALAIVDAWLELEADLKTAAAANGIDVNDRVKPFDLLRAFMRIDKVDQQGYEIFVRLRNIRNRAVHERLPNLTANEALEFRELTRRFAAKLLA